MIKIISLFLLIGLSGNSIAQEIPNSGFESPDDTSQTGMEYWQMKGTGMVGRDVNIAFEGKASAIISREDSTGTTYFFQEIPFTSDRVGRYSFICAVKAGSLEGKAGFGTWVINKSGQRISGHRAVTIHRDQDWQLLSGEFYSDEEAVTLRIFCSVEGSGTVWFDQISIKPIPSVKGEIKKEVSEYVNVYFDYINKHSIITDKSLIKELKGNTLELCKGITSLETCQDILKRYTTMKLKDGHSSFSTTAEWKELRSENGNASSGLISYAEGKLLADSIAYVTVPGFYSANETLAQNYIDSLQERISSLDHPGIKGWIIDLSENKGGNCFPMISGLGSFIGEGNCVYAETPDKKRTPLHHEKGITRWYEDSLVQASSIYNLKNKNLPVAVIYGKSTASSGEVCAIAMIGIPGIKSFGQQTSGAVTCVSDHYMPDDAVLHLAFSWMADRNGKVYKSGIKPDVECSDLNTSIYEASKWILKQ